MIGFSYDALGRLTAKDLPGGEPDVTYGYDNFGRLTSASQTGNALSFTYDQLSRTLTQAGPLGTMTSQWDLAGRRTRLTWPDGFYAGYDYDNAGEMTAIRENGATSGVGVLAAFGYDDFGRRSSLTRGNGTVTRYGYDGTSHLASLAQDLAGTSSDQSQGFGYDPSSSIISQTRSNDGYAFRQAYTINRGYAANGLNQYTAAGTTTPAYDARGNVAALTGPLPRTYGYSSENLLTAASGGAALAYDPALRLYQVSAGAGATTRYAYDGDRMASEYNAAGALQRRYVFGPGADEPLVWYEGSGTADRRWLHADERGSVTAISDASGAAIAIDSYDDYGTPATTNLGRFQYTGQAWLPEIGLYYDKARLYNPALGRFMQTDPIGYGDGLNWYNYVGSDPVNRIDPSGTDCLMGINPCTITPLPGGGYSVTEGGSVTTFDGNGNPVSTSSTSPIVVTGGGTGVGSGNIGGGVPGGGGLGGGTTQNGQTDPNVILVTAPTHQRFIQMTTLSYAHIFTQHAWFPFPNTSRFLEQFRDVTSIYGLVDETIVGNTGVPQPNGNVRYEGTLPFDVGTDQNGNPTGQMTVIVRPTGPGTGDVVTAYPGR